ncbi:myosin-2-like [Diospyros lotus]|uniref:myosin-2-like n=1 Tax=Diospyros lotus TaxID=55363 RepID=UPI002251A461|nr:myosin-2-like [Diospyros lotus]XP_052200751.1 myosin-2-like [Diospyros lotus]
MMCSASTRSSLELMLESIQRRDEQPSDVPPALPVRPLSKARLPPARRGLPVRLQSQRNCLREYPKENEAKEEEDMRAKLGFGLFEIDRKRTKRGAFVELPYKQSSVEGDDTTACVPISNLSPGSTKECKCGNNFSFVLNKIYLFDVMDDSRERVMKEIVEIQRYFRGHQARCYYLELKSGITTLQAFVRGEKARKDYQILTRRSIAVIVIQQHTKRWIEWRTMQRRQRAVISLQSAIRGWLSQRSIQCNGNFRLLGTDPGEDIRKPDWRNLERKDFVQVSPAAIADLQGRIRRMETELGQKEVENAALRLQLQQYDKKWLQYDEKMKSMEKLWQDQLTSLQMSLAAARKTLLTGCTTDYSGKLDPFPIYHCYGADDTSPLGARATDRITASDISNLLCDAEPQQTNCRLDNETTELTEQERKKVFCNNPRTGDKLKSVHLTSSTSMRPNDGFRKLKLKFEAWKKDYRIRLKETKEKLHDLDNSETKKNRRKWWGR